MLFSLSGGIVLHMFGCVTHRHGNWHSGRVLDIHLILYVTEGAVRMRIGGTDYLAVAGDVLFIPKGTPYMPLASDGCTYYFFHFDMEEAHEEKKPLPALSALEGDCEGFSHFLDHATEGTVTIEPHTTPTRRGTIEELLSRAAGLDLLHDASQKRRLVLYFRRFLACLTGDEDEEKQTGPTVGKIIRHIHKHIKEPISLATIAARFYLSESYIARIFKSELGETVGSYILKQKINLACALLVNTDMSVSEVAEEVGFSTPYYFSTVFSRHTGVSPSAYRRRA